MLIIPSALVLLVLGNDIPDLQEKPKKKKRVGERIEFIASRVYASFFFFFKKKHGDG